METNEEMMQSLEPKPNRSKLPILAAVAVVVICVAGVVGWNLTRTDPKATVTEALTTTFEQPRQRVEALGKQYPAISAADSISSLESAYQIDYSFGFAGLEGIPYANMINAFLSDSSLNFSVVQDLAAKSSGMQMSANLMGQPFFEGSYFLTPDRMTLSSPTLLKTAVSINPESFTQEYPNSALGTLYPLDAEQLEMIDTQLELYRTQMQMIDPQMATRLEENLKTIGLGLLDQATFSALEEKGHYQVTLPGDAARNALIEMIQLCVNTCYSEAFLNMPAQYEGGMTMQEQLDASYAAIPSLEMTADLTIADRIITAATITLTHPVQEGEEAPFETILLTYDKTDEGNHSFDLSLSGGSSDGFSAVLDFLSAEENDRYIEAMSLNAALTDSDLFDLTWDFSTGKDGSVSHQASFFLPSADSSFSFTADGTITGKDGDFSANFPAARFAFASGDSSEEMAVLLDMAITVGAPVLTADPAAQDLLALSEEEIAAISQEISSNVSALQNQIYSLLLS